MERALILPKPEAAAFERGRIVPPLAERLHQVADRRTMNLRLDVMPRWSGAERGIEDFGLRVAFMTPVVATPVAEVDAADEGEILLVAIRVQQHYQLLVVRPSAADARIQQDDAARIVHDLGEIARLLLVETEYPGVGSPQEPSDLDAPARETGEQFAEASGRSGREAHRRPPANR